MNRKIVILNGSPRKSGNTAALIRELTKGAQEAENTVTSFLLHDMDISGCRGCMGGGKNPDSPCTIKDDMEKIYPAYKEADIVVLASPLYYWGISGQLKTTFDRLFAVMESGKAYSTPKDGILLMAAEGNGYEETVYWYERLMGHLGWKDRGQILASDARNPGDIEGHAELGAAYALGKSL